MVASNKIFAASFGSDFFGDGTGASTRCAAAAGGLTRAELDQQLPPLSVTLPGSANSPAITLALRPTESYLTPLPGAGVGVQTVYRGGVVSASETILGVAVLRSTLTVFKVDTGEIGFAPQVGCSY